jgi:hypothetical protein
VERVIDARTAAIVEAWRGARRRDKAQFAEGFIYPMIEQIACHAGRLRNCTHYAA